jgi:hypothetical protein
MTKTEACKLLKISERTLDKYVRTGRLTASQKRTATNQWRADYDAAEVQALKAELDAPKPRSVPEVTTLAKAPQTGAIERLRPLAPGQSVPSHWLLSPEHFPALAQALGAGNGVSVAEKLWLDVKEAAELSGLPEALIRRAIRSKTLAGHKTNAWKIKRTDLEVWATNPFESAAPQTPATTRKAPQGGAKSK